MRGYKFSTFDFSVVAVALLVSVYNSKEFFGPMIQEDVDSQTNIETGNVNAANASQDLNNRQLSFDEKKNNIAEQVREIKENLGSDKNND